MRFRDYMALWLGTLSASFAMNMQQVARGWFVFDLTESAVDLAWVTMSFTLPQMLLSLPGGVLADRAPKRLVIFSGQAFNCAGAAMMAYFILTESVTFYHFLVFGLVSGSILAITFPARHAMVPDVMPKRLVFSALALNTTGMNFARVLAPAIAGFLIAWIADGDTSSAFGVGVVYLVITALYLVAATSTCLVSRPGLPAKDKPEVTPWTDIVDGFRYVMRHPSIFALTVISIIPFLFAFPLNTFLPAFNETILKGGPFELGLLMSALGIGSIIGSIMLASSGQMERKGFWLFFVSILWAVAVSAFGINSYFALSIVVIALVGWCSSWSMAMNRGLTQQISRPDMFGRIMSIDMMSHGVMPLGILPLGVVADVWGVDIAIAISGVLFVTAVLILYYSTPTIRHLMKS